MNNYIITYFITRYTTSSSSSSCKTRSKSGSYSLWWCRQLGTSWYDSWTKWIRFYATTKICWEFRVNIFTSNYFWRDHNVFFSPIYRHRDSCSQSVSIASHPIEPHLISSIEVHNFVQEQRKIIANFRAQPWPMEMKIAALK